MCSGFYTVVELLPSTIIVFVLRATLREQRKRSPLLAEESREGAPAADDVVGADSVHVGDTTQP